MRWYTRNPVSVLGAGRMPDSASWISAGAAALAAVLAGLNLVYSGRRERQRWIRETLVDLLVTYLDASFTWARAAIRLPDGGDDTPARREISDAHATQDAALTKLRLMTGKAMLDAAFDLHAANHAFERALAMDPPAADEEVEQLREQLWQARNRYVECGKRTIGLSRDQSRTVAADRSPRAAR